MIEYNLNNYHDYMDFKNGKVENYRYMLETTTDEDNYNEPDSGHNI